MTQDAIPGHWERLRKSTGWLGGIAVLLVIFASRDANGLDLRVFSFAGGALFLAWTQSWLLVPHHLRQQNAEDAMWDRFTDSDWKYVDATAALSGPELDTLRDLFRAADNTGVRRFIAAKWPGFQDADVGAYTRFFNETFVNEAEAYVDEDDRLQRFDP